MAKRLNLNELAREICEAEGGAEELSIAQVKEIIKIINEIYGSYLESGIEGFQIIVETIKWQMKLQSRRR
jgi:hypothetical protein